MTVMFLPTWKSVNQEDGARCFKWVYAPDLSNAMLNDFHIFRLADAYLMKAEAILRNGGSGAEAAKYVNIIRERAYGDTKHDYETVDLNKVMLERRFEFAWECMSRQDDIRFGVFEKGMLRSPATTAALSHKRTSSYGPQSSKCRAHRLSNSTAVHYWSLSD